MTIQSLAAGLVIAFPSVIAFHTPYGDIVNNGGEGIWSTQIMLPPHIEYAAPEIIITDGEIPAEQYDILLDGTVVDTIDAEGGAG